jgi:hypothetical protein
MHAVPVTDFFCEPRDALTVCAPGIRVDKTCDSDSELLALKAHGAKVYCLRHARVPKKRKPNATSTAGLIAAAREARFLACWNAM